ncbi:hypothetical protein BGZ73_003593 [Actinomortierella ambigua]|nr:hypothetical protein BGZ73_003593 [Actinomortierella ambigua]
MDPRPTPTRTTTRAAAPRTTTAARPRTTTSEAGNRPGRATTTSETTPTNSPSTTSVPDAKSGLSTAAMAGIGAGAAALLLVIVGCLVTSFRRKNAYRKRKEAAGGHDPSRDPVNPFDVYPLENKNKYDQRSKEDSHDNSISSPLALGSDFSPYENQRNKGAEEAAREAQSRMFDQIYQEQIQSIYGGEVPMAPTRAARSSRMPRHVTAPRSNMVSPDARGSTLPVPAGAVGSTQNVEGSSHHTSLSPRAQPQSGGGGFSTTPGSPITVASSSKPCSTIVSNPTSPFASAHPSSTLQQPPPPSSFSAYPPSSTSQLAKGRSTPPPLPLASQEDGEVIEDNGQHFVLHSPSFKLDHNSDRRALVEDETDDEDTKHNSSSAPSELSYRRPEGPHAPAPSSPRGYQHQKHRPPPLQQQQHEPEGYAADRAYAAAGFPATTTARVQPAQEGPRSPSTPTSPTHGGPGGRPMMSPPSRHASPAMPPHGHASPRSQPMAYAPPQYDGSYSNNGNYNNDGGAYNGGGGGPGYGPQGGPGSAIPSPSHGYQNSPHNSSPYSNSPPMSPPMSPNQRRPGGGPGSASPGPSPSMFPSAGPSFNNGPGFNNGPPGYNNGVGGYNNGPGGFNNGPGGYQPQTAYQPTAPRGPPTGY